MKIIIDDVEYFTVEEVEKFVGMRAAAIDLRVRFGNFPAPIKLPFRKFWKKSDLDEYVKQLKQEG